MKFWDTSAVVPLCLSEPASALARQRAERLLSVYALRAADAFQLAAALVWSRGQTSTHAVVCLDERLRAAVQAEGFQLLPE